MTKIVNESFEKFRSRDSFDENKRTIEIEFDDNSNLVDILSNAPNKTVVEYINISSCNNESISSIDFSIFPRLHVLEITGCRGLQNLVVKNANLEKLNINYNDTVNLTIDCPLLIYLNAIYNKLTNVLGISKTEELEYLNLSYNNITKMPDVGMRIKGLYITHNRINNIDTLSNANIRRLYADNNHISTIPQIDGLILLSAEHNQITTISNLRNVEKLYLSYNKLSDLSFVHGMNRLKTIEIDNNHISKEEIEKIKELYPNIKVLSR